MIWAIVLVPVLAGMLVSFSGRRLSRSALAIGGCGAVLVALALALAVVMDEASGVFGWGGGLELTLGATGLSRVMAVLVPAIGAPVIAYAAFHEGERGLARLVGLLSVFIGAMELLVLASDLLTLLIGWELVGALSWALIGFEWRERDKVQSAAQAFVPTRFGDLGLFLAAGAAFAATGSMRFDALGSLSGANLDVLAAGLLVAAVAKSGQVPFSPWLFSAMAGPTPVSALLHSATMVAAGAYALARLQPVLSGAGWFGPTVIGFGLATAIAGGVVALLQDHAKRVLAASTSAQYGLMFVAIGAGFPGTAGAHLVTQAFFKALLFLAVGVAMQTVGTGDISRMRLGRSLPVIAGFALIGSLALAAVPPLGAAWSKEAIVAAAESENAALVVGVLVAGLLSAAYATRLQLLAFGRATDPGSGEQPAVRVSTVETAAIAALGIGTVLLGALWLPGSAARVESMTGGLVADESLALTAAGLVAVAVGLLAGRALARPMASAPATLADWLGIPAATRLVIVDPSLALARRLAAFDGRVVDAGVRAAGWLGGAIGRLLARRDVHSVDALVESIGRGAAGLARRSAIGDNRALDGAVESMAGGVGAAGRLARRAQTGLAHHYLLIVATGMAVLALLARTWR